MKRHRLLSLLAAGIALCALAACAGLPTTGSVQTGSVEAGDERPPDFSYRPDGPSEDATPQQIVQGFLAAGSGPRGNWEVAGQFLTGPAAETWRPQAGVTIYAPSSPPTLTVEETPEGASVTVAFAATATVDANGVYATTDDVPVTLDFTLSRVAEDQWRISSAADGIVLDSSRFRTVFRSYSLMYFDPTWTYLVPDERWFPTTNPATRIAEALVEGAPSAWLDGVVVTAFTDAVSLSSQSVPVRSSVAQVSLDDGVLDLDQTARNRMLTQLQASFASINVREVQLVVAGSALDATIVPVRSTRLDQRPLVVTEAGFGYYVGQDIEVVPGLSPALADFASTAIELNIDGTVAAVLDTDGSVRSVTSGNEVWIVDTRPGLIAPSVDPFGYVWSVPAASPAAVSAFTRDGATVYPIPNAWPGADSIIAMRVSRDGTRVAALVDTREGQALWVAGIERSGQGGAPVGFTDAVQVASVSGSAVDLTWVDTATLGIIGTDDAGSYYYEHNIGGMATRFSAPDGVQQLSAGNPASSVRALDENGQLYVRRGSTWLASASGILVLAQQ